MPHGIASGSADVARRIVVTAGDSPLGRRVLEQLRVSPSVEFSRGLEASHGTPGVGRDDRDIVPFVPDHRALSTYLREKRIDTVIQCGVTADRSGLSSASQEADVITTMCVGAAIGVESSSVRSWVVVSSTGVYPVESHSPLLQHERQRLAYVGNPLASSIAEAEEYARDVARRRTHVSVAILRLQQLAGKNVRGPLARLLAQKIVPAPVGFDPALQLLHLDDAAGAIVFSARSELAGVYNLASRGIVRLNEAIRETRHRKIPVLPVRVGLAEPLLKRLGVPHVPGELHDLLRFGHAVDTEKLERAGWCARHDQQDCLRTLRSN